MIRHITLIAGARPNFMKIAPLIRAIQTTDIQFRLVHTGQHYDKVMSQTFFEELNIPQPHVNLACGGGSQAEQTAAIMVAFEKDLMAHPTDLVIVVGDVTSTMACTIVAKKLGVKVAHVEAGIRSYDMSMPEEINRMVTDTLADYFFTTTTWAGENLLKVGIAKEKIYWVGNVMIDTLLANRERFRQPECYEALGLEEKKYFVLTLHRPANVDETQHLKTVMGVPCMTLRNNTERPETCEMGTNELIGTDPKNIRPAMERLFAGNWKKGSIPPLWDGQTAKRIVEILQTL